MQDRLAELRRQRALIAEHLAWIDREIAAAAPSASSLAQPVESSVASDVAVPAPPPAPAPASLSAPAIPPPNAAPAPTTRPSMIGGLRVVDSPLPAPLPEVDPANIKSQTKSGCFFYVFLAAAALAGGTWLLVWAARSDWAKETASPYILKATVGALIVALAAAIRSLIKKLRSE